jgi:hypothetical protein
MVLHQKESSTLKSCPRITKFVWNIVDPPWSFYSIKYELDNYTEHIVYVPEKTITEELKTMSIVEIVTAKLQAQLDCVPEHVDRVSKDMKDATKRSAKQATRSRSKSKLDKPSASNG